MKKELIEYVSSPVTFLSYSPEKQMKLCKMLPCCLIFVPDNIVGEDKNPLTSTMRPNEQRKCVPSLIKPVLWYRWKTERMKELEQDFQTSLQPLLPVWDTVLSEHWGALEIGMCWKF